jgi:hypothetical protein
LLPGTISPFLLVQIDHDFDHGWENAAHKLDLLDSLGEAIFLLRLIDTEDVTLFFGSLVPGVV